MAGKRANYQWTVGPSTANTVFASTASNVVSFQSIVTFTDPGTIRRIIVDVFVGLASVTDGARAIGRVGMILGNPREIAVGASAVPAPITNGEDDWLWNRAYAFHQELVTSGFKYIPLSLHDDVRGMRKVKEGQSLICVVENAVGNAVDTVASARLLFST